MQPLSVSPRSTPPRIAVTGGSGFIGTNLVGSLIDGGVPVVNLDIVAPRNPAHATGWNAVDVMDRAALQRALAEFRPTHIHHLAARTDLAGHRLKDYEVNHRGVENLLAACRGLKSLERVVFASSRLVCKIGYQPLSDEDYCPTTPYGESKVAAEQIVRRARDERYARVIIRPTSIWGPWFGVPYRNFFGAVGSRRYFHPGRLKVRKSFGYVGNTVFQLGKLMETDRARVDGKTFYLADYEPIEVRAFADMIAGAFGLPPVHSLPLTALRGLARLGDLAKRLGYKDPPLTSFRLDNICADMLHEFGELPSITGPLPHSLDAAVAHTTYWMRSHE